MIEIPAQLQNGYRFIKLKPESKAALETNWTTTSNYSWSEIVNEKACGIIIGNNDVVIDIDNKILANHLVKTNVIPDTFTVKTPGKPGFHFFFKCPGAKAKNLRMAGVPIGEIRTGNQYVVAPNSQLGEKRYEIIKNLPFTETTFAEIEEKLKRYTNWDPRMTLRPCFLKALNEKALMNGSEGHEFRTALACESLANGLTPEEATSLFCFQIDFGDGSKSAEHVNRIFEKKLKPWTCQTIAEKCTPFVSCVDCKRKEKIVVYANQPQSLKEVHERLARWLYLTDTNHIDLELATAISIESTDPPLWIILLAGSGDSKTATAMGLDGKPKVKLIDQITPNYLASGMKDAHDLGEELQHDSHLLLIPDLACFSTLDTDDKKRIWGQFRTLYDGYIVKGTGNDVSKKYTDCHVALLACGTPSFKAEQIVKDQLGTRELVYSLPPVTKSMNLKKVRKSMTHQNQKPQMDFEIKETMQGFLQGRKFNKDLVTPGHIILYIERKIFELSVFRATAQIDYYSGELFGTVDQEVPTRVAQQFDLLYRSLHSLDPDYPDKKYYEIIDNMVASSSVPLRKDIYDFMVNEQKKYDKEKTLLSASKTPFELAKQLNKSRKAVKIQCLILLELGIFNVEYTETDPDTMFFSLRNTRKNAENKRKTMENKRKSPENGEKTSENSELPLEEQQKATDSQQEN